jgi:hypothetical protein
MNGDSESAAPTAITDCLLFISKIRLNAHLLWSCLSLGKVSSVFERMILAPDSG